MVAEPNPTSILYFMSEPEPNQAISLYRDQNQTSGPKVTHFLHVEEHPVRLTFDLQNFNVLQCPTVLREEAGLVSHSGNIVCLYFRRNSERAAENERCC